MRAKLLTAGASALSIISVMLLAATAEAQAVRRVVGLKTHSPTSRDINGVNLATGQFTPPPVVATIGNGTSSFSESIGGTDFPNGSNFVGGITFVDPNDFVTQKQSAKTVIKNDNVVLVYFGNYRKMFTLENGEYVAHDGSMDRLEGGGASLGNFFLGSATLTTSDGTKVYFTGLTPWVSVGTVPLLPSDYGVDAKFAILSRIEKPDGETYDLVFTQEGIDTGYGQFDQQGSTSPPDQLVKTRLDEIRGNLGYSMWGQSLDGLAAYTITNYAAPAPLLRSVYVSAVHSPTSYQALPTESVVVRAQSNWDGMIIETQSKEIFGNGVLAWGSTDRYAYEERVQDRVHTVCSEPASQWVNDYPETNMAADIATPFFSTGCVQSAYFRYVEQSKIRNMGGVTTALIDYFQPNTGLVPWGAGYLGGCRGASYGVKPMTCVKTVTRKGSVWKYNWSYTLAGDLWNVDIEDPFGKHRYVSINYDSYIGLMVRSETDELGRTTSYDYDDGVHLSKVTFDEGNYTTYEYDKNRLTHVREYPKGGGAPKLTQALYPSTCDAATAKICNQPTWVRDPIGNLPENIGNPDYRTDYTYHPEHGGIATETLPPNANGIRAQTRYTYAQKQAQTLNASGQYINTASPVWRLVRTSTCGSSTNSCAGTADETVTEYAYDHPNLFMTAKTVRAGNANILAPHSDTNVWHTTEFGYNWLGDTVMVDGPLPGDVDKSYAIYDERRRKVYEIGADPDGTGPLRRVVLKHTYDVDSNLTKTESGTASGVTFASNLPSGVTDFVVTSVKDMEYVPETGQLLKTTLIEK